MPRCTGTATGSSCFAGSPGYMGLFLEEFRHLANGNSILLTRERIQESAHQAYLAFVAKTVSSSVLSPFGITLDSFIRDGRSYFGDDVFKTVHERLEAESRILQQEQMLVTGWGKSPSSAMIFEIGGSGYTASHELTGMASIGSGAEVAMSTLLTLGQKRSSGLAETLYRVAAAKFMSEKANGEYVGMNTAIHISWQRQQGENDNKPPGVLLHPDALEQLRTDWDNYGRPKIADQCLMSAASIVGSLGIASVDDMRASIAASIRLRNQSNCVSSHAEEEDPEFGRASDKDQAVSE